MFQKSNDLLVPSLPGVIKRGETVLVSSIGISSTFEKHLYNGRLVVIPRREEQRRPSAVLLACSLLLCSRGIAPESQVSDLDDFSGESGKAVSHHPRVAGAAVGVEPCFEQNLRNSRLLVERRGKHESVPVIQTAGIDDLSLIQEHGDRLRMGVFRSSAHERCPEKRITSGGGPNSSQLAPDSGRVGRNQCLQGISECRADQHPRSKDQAKNNETSHDLLFDQSQSGN